MSDFELNSSLDKSKEYILCSAIWYNDGLHYEHQPKNISSGFVICGRRHHNCFTTLKILSLTNFNSINKNNIIQGFITNLDNFVDRKEGYKIALNFKQIKEKVNEYLISEDLY